MIFEDLPGLISDMISRDRTRHHYLARVTSIEGTQLNVLRLGAKYNNIEGPYPMLRSVIGDVSVGDRVLVMRLSSTPIVIGVVESTLEP